MITGGQVILMLCPEAEFTIYDDDYDSIVWHNGKALITKAEYEAGFVQYAEWKAEQDKIKADKKIDLLNRLGITEEEIKILIR